MNLRERIYPEVPNLEAEIVDGMTPYQYSAYLTWQLECYQRRIGSIVAAGVVFFLLAILVLGILA